MFIKMILDHIPRSWKAALALLVMIGALSQAFNALAGLFVEPTGAEWFRCIAGLVLGVPAAIYFYVEQQRAGRQKSPEQIQLETLSEAAREERIRRAAASATAYHLNDIPEQPARHYPEESPR